MRENERFSVLDCYHGQEEVMNSRKIIEQEGYTYNNLNEQNKSTINWLNWLKDCTLDYLKSEYAIEEDDGIIARAVKEVIAEVIDDLEEYFEIHISETQIGLIESQEEDV